MEQNSYELSKRREERREEKTELNYTFIYIYMGVGVTLQLVLHPSQEHCDRSPDFSSPEIHYRETICVGPLTGAR